MTQENGTRQAPEFSRTVGRQLSGFPKSIERMTSCAREHLRGEVRVTIANISSKISKLFCRRYRNYSVVVFSPASETLYQHQSISRAYTNMTNSNYPSQEPCSCGETCTFKHRGRIQGHRSSTFTSLSQFPSKTPVGHQRDRVNAIDTKSNASSGLGVVPDLTLKLWELTTDVLPLRRNSTEALTRDRR